MGQGDRGWSLTGEQPGCSVHSPRACRGRGPRPPPHHAHTRAGLGIPARRQLPDSGAGCALGHAPVLPLPVMSPSVPHQPQPSWEQGQPSPSSCPDSAPWQATESKEKAEEEEVPVGLQHRNPEHGASPGWGSDPRGAQCQPRLQRASGTSPGHVLPA